MKFEHVMYVYYLKSIGEHGCGGPAPKLHVIFDAQSLCVHLKAVGGGVGEGPLLYIEEISKRARNLYMMTRT